MIDVEHVTKNYGSLRAVGDVSFRLEKNEALGLLGPNAAGKTTLMRIMTGYLPATEGAVRMEGLTIADNPIEFKRRMGYLPENPPLYPEMTVRAYLQFAAEIKGVPARERRARVDDAIDKTSLGDVAHRLIENISKGYRQRVGLAQALVHNPEALILDEPTAGLDPKQIIGIRNLIRELAKEHTILLSSHILPEVSATCDRVVILNEGCIVAVDTQEELKRRVQGGDRLTVEIAGAAPEQIQKALAEVGNVEKVEAVEPRGTSLRASVSYKRGADVRGDIFRKIVANNWTLLELSREGLTLEDVFLKLTREEEVSDDE
jgi:ABC-2 type transport system ATP-binding protein